MFSGEVAFEPSTLTRSFSLSVNEHCQLRLLNKADADELFALIEANRTYLKQWLSWLETTQTVDDTRHFIQLTRDRYQDKQGFAAALCYQQHIVGIAGLNGIDWANRRSSIGYWIAQSYQGKGLITHACKAILNYAFGELNLNRIEILCAAQNTRSQAIPHRLGFTYEGTLREAQWLNAHFVDHHIYSILQRDWRSPTSQSPIEPASNPATDSSADSSAEPAESRQQPQPH